MGFQLCKYPASHVNPPGRVEISLLRRRSIVQQLGGTVSINSLLGKGTQVTICLPLQGDSHFNRMKIKQADSEDRQTPFEPAENCLETLRKVAYGKIIGLHQRKISKHDRTSAENMVLDYIDVYLGQWYGLTVTKFSAWNEVPEVDLIIAVVDEQDESFSWSDPSGIVRQAPVLLVTDRYFGHKETRDLPDGIFCCYTRPVGPYKFARCLLACFEKLENFDVDSKGRLKGDNSERNLNTNSGQDAASSAPGKQQCASSSDESTSTGKGGSGEHQSPTAQSSLPTIGRLQNGSKEVGSNRTDKAQDSPDKRGTPRDPHSLAKPLSKPSDPGETTDPSPDKQSPLRILLVEDNEINLQLLCRFLTKRKGDTINLARNGYEAVAAVQEAPDPYDVIFMDISMPGIDGFEATRQIRRYEGQWRARARAESLPQHELQLAPGRILIPKTYIVALTGLGAGRDRDEASESGFDEFLTKPIPFQKVGRMLNERSRHLGRT